MIDVATKDDIPTLVRMGLELVKESETYKRRGYDAAKVSNSLNTIIDSPMGVIFVSRINNEITGGIIGMIDERWFNNDLVAHEYVFFVTPKKRNGITAIKLLKAFTSWSKEMGATYVIMGLTTEVNPEGTDKLYKSCGFENYGHLFRMEL